MRSPENERFEPKYVKFSEFFSLFPLMEKVEASGDDVLRISVFVALIIRPAKR